VKTPGEKIFENSIWPGKGKQEKVQGKKKLKKKGETRRRGVSQEKSSEGG